MIDDIKINIEKINNEINNKNPKNFFKIVFLGDSGVGSKTSLIKIIIEDIFDPNVVSTNGASLFYKTIYSKNGKAFFLNICDTAGQERFRELSKMFYFDANCIVLGYDISRKVSFESIDNYWYPTSKKISGVNLFYLIGNKADLYEREEVPESEAREYAKNNNMRFFKISCKCKTGINEFLEDLAEELSKF